jgi:hypothetical protein
MSVEVALQTPLAHALNTVIQPKLVEVGWSTGGDDDSALSEYIILMLVNGKTQEQIAAELSGDLLNLGPDDPGARDFSQWLFQQVEVLNSQQSAGDEYIGGDSATGQGDAPNGAQDADMGDVSGPGENNVYAISSVDLTFAPDPGHPQKATSVLTFYRPTGPKSMRNSAGNRPRDPRDKRMLGHLAKAMDRSSDSTLHRVRQQAGSERINMHRAPPTGPRQHAPVRGGSRMMNGRSGMGGMGVPTGPAGSNIMAMSPQQQYEMLAMLEQQSRMMAQILTPQQQQQMLGGGPMQNPGVTNGYHQQQHGKSLFDRVQAPQRQPHGSRNGLTKQPFVLHEPAHEDAASSMDVQMSHDKQDRPEPSPDTTCKFNLSCTKKDCPFAHQSPAAPPGTAIDISDVCSFGAACKNFKCAGRHPSPAQKLAHQTEQDCKYFPNCANGSKCPFRHPSMPICRNGADCVTPNCKFTHVTTLCKFNPCLNPICTFKHVEGQKRGKFEDKVWVADGNAEHVSERKFVNDNDKEELIIPGAGEPETLNHGTNSPAELVT